MVAIELLCFDSKTTLLLFTWVAFNLGTSEQHEAKSSLHFRRRAMISLLPNVDGAHKRLQRGSKIR